MSSNDNQTQLARQIAQAVWDEFWANLKSEKWSVDDLTAIILRKLNGSDEYRRGVLDAAKVAHGHKYLSCDGHRWLTTASFQIEDKIRALLTTEQGVSGREEFTGRTVSLEGRLELEMVASDCDVHKPIMCGLAFRDNGASNVANVERDLWQLNGKEVRVTIEWRDANHSAVAPAQKE